MAKHAPTSDRERHRLRKQSLENGPFPDLIDFSQFLLYAYKICEDRCTAYIAR